MGETVTYTAVDDWMGPSVASYTWEYKYTSGSCQGNWIDSGFDWASVSFFESLPGTWDVRLTVTYEPWEGSWHEPTVITKSVTVAPATKFTIIDGLGTNTPIGTNIVLKFRVEGASRPCGPDLGGVAQERLTNRWCLSPPYPLQNPADTDWSPPTPDPAFQLQPSTNEVWDTKVQNTLLWDSLPADPNHEYRRDVQSLRIKYIDPCNDTKYLDIGSRTVMRFKVDANNWKITVSP